MGGFGGRHCACKQRALQHLAAGVRGGGGLIADVAYAASKAGVLSLVKSVAREIAGSRTVNTLGFCVGGTILACALAVLAARRDASVQSAPRTAGAPTARRGSRSA